MRYALVSCRVFQRELLAAIVHSPHTVSPRFLPIEWHDLDRTDFRRRLQAAVKEAGEHADAVLLGYGLCGHAIAGLRAGAVPLVLPRAHDCLSLFFGGEARCRAYIDANPGTFFRTAGWLDRGTPIAPMAPGYSRLAFIRTVPDSQNGFERAARQEAEAAGWSFDAVSGNLLRIHELVSGEWSERDFLVVPPGRSVTATLDDRVIAINPAECPA